MACGTGAPNCGPGGNANSVAYGYTLGPAGNRTSVTELAGRTVTYGYDDLYRLTSETIAGGASQNGSIGYIYDAVGNRQSLTSTVAAIPAGTLFYDANDRLSTDIYDNDGNTVSSGSIANVYDFENHLVQHGAVTIVYDGDGNRVAKTAAGVTTKYLVDTNSVTGYAQVLEELNGTTVTRKYTYGFSLISENQTIGNTATVSYYGFDGHGSVRQLTDRFGNVSDTYTYDAFGNLLTTTGSTPNNYKFAGEQFDPDLGLYYNRARYLDVRQGSFWGMDSAEGDGEAPISLHRYLYADANPANRIDRSGDESLAEVVETASIYVQNVFSNARTAFAAGGTAVGLFFNGVGAFAQNTARQVISIFAADVEEIQSVEYDSEVIVQDSRRVIDFLVKTKEGAEDLFIEAKYSLPRSGAALTRLVGQVTNAVNSGRVQQVVVWTLKEPSVQQVKTVVAALGNLAGEVQFVDGAQGLYDYLSFYFRY